MSKNILFVGKEYTKESNLQELATQFGCNPLVTTASYTDQENDTVSSTLAWNRASPISAHTIIVKAENYFTNIDAAVIFFDALASDKNFNRNTIDEYTRATDELILGYTYITTELLRRFSEKNHGKLFFVLQGMPSTADFLKNPPKQGLVTEKVGTITAMAQAAFKAFAENVASEYYKASGSPIFLLDIDNSVSEQELLTWISQQIEGDNPTYKTPKNALTWNDLSAKSKISLPFFN